MTLMAAAAIAAPMVITARCVTKSVPAVPANYNVTVTANVLMDLMVTGHASVRHLLNLIRIQKPVPNVLKITMVTIVLPARGPKRVPWPVSVMVPAMMVHIMMVPVPV